MSNSQEWSRVSRECIPMKNHLYSFVCFFCFWFFQITGEPLHINVAAEAAILINPDNGKILYSKNAFEPHYPASTTKMATALFALKLGKHSLQELIRVDRESLSSVSSEAKLKAQYRLPAYWLEPDGSHIGLKEGEQLSLNDLLFTMMVASGNDAANAVAAAFGKPIPAFVLAMNDYLKSIGCERTQFLNPHGLHHPQHKTCAFDLSLIAKEALKEPLFKEMVKTVHFTRPKTDQQKAYLLVQTNRLLRQGKHYYAKAIGIKTGYHSHAKHAFVGAAEWKGRSLILVFLKCSDRGTMFDEAIQLFEAAFNQPKIEKTFLEEGVQPFTRKFSHADQLLTTYLDQKVSLSYYSAEDPNPTCILHWDTPELPIWPGKKVGELQLISDAGEVLKTVPLLSKHTVGYVWPINWFVSFQSFVRENPFLASVIFLIILAIFFISLGRFLLRQ